MEQEQLKDPVCQMDIDPERAIKVTHDGKDYYFCGGNCKMAFEGSPEQFITQ